MHFQKHAQFYFILTVTFVFGFSAHGFRFANLYFHHDDYYFPEKPFGDWQISLGRPFQTLCWWAIGYLGAPWLVGLLTVVWMALGNYLVIRALNVRSLSFSALLCGVISTNTISTLLTATYIACSDGFMLAYCLSSMGIYLLAKNNRTWPLSAVVFACSLAIYQSFINIPIFLLLAILVRDTIRNYSLAALGKRIVKYLFALIGGGAFYLLIVFLSLRVFNIDLDNGIHGLGQAWTGMGVGKYSIGLVFETYKAFIKYMLHPQTVHPFLAELINICIFVISISAFIFLLVRKKVTGLRLVFVIVCVVLMPFGINFAYFVSGGHYTQLIYFPFFFLYAFAIVLWQEAGALLGKEKKLSGGGTLFQRWRMQWGKLLHTSGSVLLSLLVLFFVIYANQAHLRRALEFEATESYFTKVTYNMEQTEGYVPGETPVLFLGSPDKSVLHEDREGFENITGTGFYSAYATTHDAAYKYFFNEVLSYNINLLPQSDASRFSELAEVRSMPLYPQKGSCRLVEGTLVVKLSE